MPIVSGGSGVNPLTTKGDLFTFSTAAARLGVGADTNVLTADSAQTTGIKWAPSASGLPVWMAQITPLVSFTNNQGTWVRQVDTAEPLCGFLFNSTTAQNDQLTWPVVLSAGTWNLDVLYVTNSNCGIGTFSLDGTSVGTIDAYTVGTGANTLTTISAINVAADGKKLFSMKMAAKNASSSAFRFNLILASFVRTA